MQKKREIKPHLLRLTQETIRKLGVVDLTKVQGGGGVDTYDKHCKMPGV